MSAGIGCVVTELDIASVAYINTSFIQTEGIDGLLGSSLKQLSCKFRHCSVSLMTGIYLSEPTYDPFSTLRRFETIFGSRS